METERSHLVITWGKEELASLPQVDLVLLPSPAGHSNSYFDATATLGAGKHRTVVSGCKLTLFTGNKHLKCPCTYPLKNLYISIHAFQHHYCTPSLPHGCLVSQAGN